MHSKLEIPEDILGPTSKTASSSPGLVDLSWFSEGTVGYPSASHPSDIRTQLASVWHHFQEPGTHTGGIDNVINPSEVVKKASDAKTELLAAVKKAANARKVGKALTSITANYPADVVESAKDELEKLAAEQGLIGNVYMDLSAYPNRIAAEKHLASFKKMPEFMVGTPYAEVGQKFASDKFLGKSVVASVDYSPELLARFSARLAAEGLIEEGEILNSKEDLRTAFLGGFIREASAPVSEETIEHEAADLGQGHEELLAKMDAEYQDILKQEKSSQMTAEASSVQANLLAGKYAKTASQNPVVQKLASLAGFIGAAAVDLSLFKSAGEATRAIKSASIRPKFAFNGAISGAPVAWGQGCAESNGLKLLESLEDFSLSDAEDFSANLIGQGRVPQESVGQILTEVQDPIHIVISVVKKANDPSSLIKMRAVADIEASESPEGFEHDKVAVQEEKAISIDQLKLATTKSLENGISLGQVTEKVASVVGDKTARSIVASSLQSMTVVDANSLDNCSEYKMSLARTASIKKASKCSSCSHCTLGGCSMQQRSFVGSRVASVTDFLSNDEALTKTASSVNDMYIQAQEIQIDIGRGGFHSGIDLSGGEMTVE